VSDASPERRVRPGVLALLAGIAVVWFSLDQFTKHLIETNLTEGEVVPVLGNVLQWYFVRNPGAAFSMIADMTWILTIVATAVVVVIVVLARRIQSKWWALVFGLVLGGALGNLFDRLFRPPSFGEGHVVDFISTPWMMPAIYNVADIGVVVGMCLFVLLTILDVGLDGRRRKRGDDEPADDAEATPDESAGA
jgi:signal peptidase II